MWERLGSGGPRGLQILRSGVESVRGGFDSHAFPPFAAVLTLVLALGPAAAQAQAPAPPESARAVPRTIGLPPPGRFEAPRWVMVRSLVIPGWGQFYNHSWLKAAAVAGATGALGVNILRDLDDLDRLNGLVLKARSDGDADAELAAVNAYNDRQGTLVTREWLLGVVVVYAMVDAYVDAHFRHFDVEFKHDPALPEGVPVRPKSRLSIRWRF